MALAGESAPAGAQLTPPGDHEQFLRLSGFLNRGHLLGAFSGLYEKDFDARKTWKGSLAWDYGSLSRQAITASGTPTDQEDEVSKNAGTAALSFFYRRGSEWLYTLDAVLEHKRFRRAVGKSGDEILYHGETHTVRPLGAVGVRHLSARLLGGNPDTATELAWRIQARALTANALVPDVNPDGTVGREVRMGFLEPSATIWYSFLPKQVTYNRTARGRDGSVLKDAGGHPKREPTPITTYQMLLRGEAALMHSLGGFRSGRGNWEVGLTYLFNPRVGDDGKTREDGGGIELRYFDGYFEHNLRDRKRTVSLNILWRF